MSPFGPPKIYLSLVIDWVKWGREGVCPERSGRPPQVGYECPLGGHPKWKVFLRHPFSSVGDPVVTGRGVVEEGTF